MKRKQRMKRNSTMCIVALLLVTLLSGCIQGNSNVQTSTNSALDSEEMVTVKENKSVRDSVAESEWNLDYMDVPEAWDVIDKVKPKKTRQDSDKVIVATLDTGAYYEHEDLQENIDVTNCVSVAGKTAPYQAYQKPRFSHGTTTAGLIAATSNNHKGISGVAAGNDNDLISLMPINVFRDTNYQAQRSATTEDIIKGINYASEKGAQVICMCLGHSSSDRDSLGQLHDDKALAGAINNIVYKKNIVVVCSAGNHNDTRIWYPSDFAAAISVINTKKYTNAWSRKCKAPGSSYGKKKDISAPGKNVRTVAMNGGYGVASGTSASAPAVAGVVALMLYVNPNLKVSQVKDILYSTATDLAETGYDIYTGYGNVNAHRAVLAAAGMSSKITVEKLKTPVVKAQSAGHNSIKVSWKQTTGANRYYIYRALKKGGAYKRIKKVEGGSTKYYIDRKRAYGKRYYYKVKAYGTTKDGKKTKSNLSSPNAAKARGARKTALSQCKMVNYKTLRISWKKVSKADGYAIYRKTGRNGSYRQIKIVSGKNAISYKNKRLKTGTRYSFKIRSYRLVKGKKYYSEYSNTKSSVPRLATPVLEVSKKGKGAKLIWRKVSGATGYKIYRSKKAHGSWELIRTVKSSTQKYRDKKLKARKKYRYKVRAYRIVKGKTVYSEYSTIQRV